MSMLNIQIFIENNNKTLSSQLSLSHLTSVKLVGYLILDIGYSILENFPSPAPYKHSPSVMRYGLTNDTVF